MIEPALPLVSVIVPCKAPGAVLTECLQAISTLTYPNVEAIVLPDDPVPDGLPGAVTIPTGPVGPAHKRDRGADAARGEILAFIDDDAYPRADWLDRAVAIFAESEIVAVCGPGVTPPTDGILAQASGWVYASLLGGGNYRYRVLPEPARWVDDFPSMYFLVRSAAFEAAGGFDTHFYPGEDTKLCLALLERGGKIRYDPDVLVYHHRRDLFRPHLRQIVQYGIHRGHFARKYPRTSLRLSYLIPTIWVIGLVAGPLTIRNIGPLWTMYKLAVALYGLALAATGGEIAARTGQPLVALMAILGVVATHAVYGIGFVRGFFSRALRR